MKASSLIFILLFMIRAFDVNAQYDLKKYYNYNLKSINYLHTILPSDSLCKQSVKLASSDLSGGKLIFCMPRGLKYAGPRFENALMEILLTEGWELYNDTIDQDPFLGEVPGCYCAKINQSLYQSVGNDFRKNLILSADSLYAEEIFKKDLIVDQWNCDVKPYCTSADDLPESITVNVQPDSLCEPGDYIDIIFVVEKDGKISDVFLSPLSNSPSINKPCEKALLEEAKKTIKRDRWIPGYIKEKAVRSRIHLRIRPG